eukprot:4078768-Prymnesium_polylepis.1
MSPVLPSLILPGVCENASHVVRPRRPSSQPPSIWYAAVEVPKAKDFGKVIFSAAVCAAAAGDSSWSTHILGGTVHAQRSQSAPSEPGARGGRDRWRWVSKAAQCWRATRS